MQMTDIVRHVNDGQCPACQITDMCGMSNNGHVKWQTMSNMSNDRQYPTYQMTVSERFRSNSATSRKFGQNWFGPKILSLLFAVVLKCINLYNTVIARCYNVIAIMRYRRLIDIASQCCNDDAADCQECAWWIGNWACNGVDYIVGPFQNARLEAFNYRSLLYSHFAFTVA